MNKEEILNRLIQKSICINAGGEGCYSPYKNEMDWFGDIDNLIIMYEQSQRENEQLKEDIEKLQFENKQLNDKVTNYSFKLSHCSSEETLQSRIDKAINNLKNSIESINKKIDNNKEPFEVIDGKIIYLNDYQVCRLKAIRMKSKEILKILKGE